MDKDNKMITWTCVACLTINQGNDYANLTCSNCGKKYVIITDGDNNHGNELHEDKQNRSQRDNV